MWSPRLRLQVRAPCCALAVQRARLRCRRLLRILDRQHRELHLQADDPANLAAHASSSGPRTRPHPAAGVMTHIDRVLIAALSLAVIVLIVILGRL